MESSRPRRLNVFVVALLAQACGAKADLAGGDEPPKYTFSDEHFGFDERGAKPWPMSLEANWPIVEVKVNGAGHRFLLDTGAQGSALNQDVFPEFVAGGPLVTVDLEVFGREFAAHQVGIDDFSMPGWFGIDGVLGADITAQSVVTLDYRQQQVWLRDAPDQPLAGFDAAQLVATSVHALTPGTKGWKEIDLHLESETVTMLVDTGASVTVVSTQLVDRLDPVGRPRVLGGTLGSGTPTVQTRAQSADLGSYDTRVRELALTATDYGSAPYDEGLLGTTFFRHFLTTVDGPGDRLLLGRYVDDSHIDPNEHVGLGFQLSHAQESFFVRGVIQGGPADGVLQVGEQVLSIGELVLLNATRKTLDEALIGYRPGAPVCVRFVRNEQEQEVQLVAAELLPSFD